MLVDSVLGAVTDTYHTESLESSGIRSIPPSLLRHMTVSIVKLQFVSCAELKFVTLLAGSPSALQTVIGREVTTEFFSLLLFSLM